MIPKVSNRRQGWLGLLACLCSPLLVAANVGVVGADPPVPPQQTPAGVLHLEDAVRQALENNPELLAFRQQRGIAAAAVVIARTYPFNPVWTCKVFADNGPEAAGISSRIAMEQKVSIDIEMRGQGQYRRQAASAALTRTDWEIAYQEEVLALRVVRAFQTVLYYDAKLRLGNETIALNERTVEQVRKLYDAATLKLQDLIVARSEVHSTRALLESARAARLKARQDLRRALGVTDDAFTVEGKLDAPPQPAAAESLVTAALERRPDLHARQAAVAEADARVGLAVADRFGNPNFGPDYEYNETRVNFIGAQLTLPLPLLNRRRGEIRQREEERTRAVLDLRSAESVIQQDVQSALERLQNARSWADVYRSKILPELATALKEMQEQFDHNQATLLNVIDIHRKLLRARDAYLDVLYEISQAQADLAAAVGDPGLAVVP